MRIGFDCSPLVVPHSPGIARVLAASLAELEARGNLEVVRLTPEPGESLRTWRQWRLPRSVRPLGLHGLHTFQAAFPLRGDCPRVQTVHELSWRHGVQESGAWRRRAWVAYGKRHAAAIVTATQFTARDLDLPLADAGGRVHVVPWANSPCFGAKPETADLPYLERLGLEPLRYVLSPGGWRAKKRPDDLLRAVEALRIQGFPEVRLVITGPRSPRTTARDRWWTQRAPAWIALESVSEAELAGLYRNAAATALVARSEGFALPVLEALASGCPVVVPAQTAQAEVAGAHATVATTLELDSLVEALSATLVDPPDPAGGIDHAAGFTWSRTAQAIETLWEGLR